MLIAPPTNIYDSMAAGIPQHWFWMGLFEPRFCATFVPGFSFVPLASRTMFFMGSFSTRCALPQHHGTYAPPSIVFSRASRRIMWTCIRKGMMDLLINAALTVVGILMLCYGGNCLVNGGESIARRMGISSFVIGMTVVAYGTSTPELAASIAAAGDHGDIILGNIVGSNIANIGLVIGVSTLLVTLVIRRQTIMREIPIMVGFSVLLVVLSIDGEISQVDGIILIFLLGGFTIYTIRRSRHDVRPDTDDSKPKQSNLKSFGLLGIGVGLLYVGAMLTVDNAVAIAEAFQIPEMIIGVTVIAIGTSLPELITSILAIRKGQIDIGVGNIIGSNIYNILMIMGVSATIAGIHVAPTIFQDYVIMIMFSMALFVSIKSGKLDYRVGMGLVAGYVVYIASSLVL